MANQDQRAALARKFKRLEMNLGDERAGGVYDAQLPLLGLGTDSGGHPVGAENEDGADRDFADGLDEDGAAPTQLVHYVAVMHNLVMDIHGLPIGFERQVHNVHGADDACAKAP